MNMRIESSDKLPPAREPGKCRWSPIIPKLKATEIGKHLVVIPEKTFNSSVGNHIEKFARARGMQVKARKRGKEIWIERIA